MRIRVVASGGVELAAGCHYYLKFFANTSFSWFGDNLGILPSHPAPSPMKRLYGMDHGHWIKADRHTNSRRLTISPWSQTSLKASIAP
jgi:hypothetical protein